MFGLVVVFIIGMMVGAPIGAAVVGLLIGGAQADRYQPRV
jgi:hypothetical protein